MESGNEEVRKSIERIEGQQEEIRDSLKEIVTILQGNPQQRYKGLLDRYEDMATRVSVLEEAEKQRRFIIATGIFNVFSVISNVLIAYINANGGRFP